MGKRRKAWRASQQAKKGTVPVSAEHNTSNPDSPSGGNRDCPPPPHKLRGLARREWIDRKAQEMYAQEVGDTIELLISSCKHTLAAYDAQMQAAKAGMKPSGEVVTAYENRMTGSLITRLLREKRTWLREFRQQLEDALKDEAALEEEQAEATTSAQDASPGPSPEGARNHAEAAVTAPPETSDSKQTEPIPPALAANETS